MVGNYLSHSVVNGTRFVHIVCVRYYNFTHDFHTKPCEKIRCVRHGSRDITVCDVLPGTYGDAIMELIL
jgi:hypothetical protein